MPPAFPRNIRCAVLWYDPNPQCYTSTGLSPSTAVASQRTSTSAKAGERIALTPHSPEGVRFALCPFHSRLLRVSRLLSLPPLTKMFQFRGFSLLSECGSLERGPARTLIRESPVQRLLAPRRGLTQLATPFLDARAKPSPRRCIA